MGSLQRNPKRDAIRRRQLKAARNSTPMAGPVTITSSDGTQRIEPAANAKADKPGHRWRGGGIDRKVGRTR